MWRQRNLGLCRPRTNHRSPRRIRNREKQMNELLLPNQIVQSRSGQPCKVVKFLGGGGQGEVYRAQWAGSDFALKWYYEQNATAEQRSAIEALIDLPGGKPSSNFLWP